VFDGSDWLDEDIEITKDGRTLSSTGPNLVAFDNRLFMFYKASGSEDIWYNVFDGTSWRDEDCQVTRDDKVRTAARPDAAAFNGLLYLVYRSAN
jgi:hypothetical protein